MMAKRKIAIIWLLAALTHHVISYDPLSIVGDELEGPNVCKRIENYNVTVLVTEMAPYQETKMVWCAQIPPRCRKTEIKLRQVNKTEVLEKMRPIRECCEGYIENNQRNRCVPHCQKPCIHGFCASPGQCKCEPGFGGPSCDISESKQLLSLEKIAIKFKTFLQLVHQITLARSARRSATVQMVLIAILMMANVTAREAIVVTNVKASARLIDMVKIAQKFVDVKTVENAITFPANVTAGQDLLDHCKYLNDRNLFKFSNNCFGHNLDAKSAVQTAKAATNVNLHAVARMEESVMRTLNSANAHQDGSVMYVPTGVNLDVMD